MNDEPLGPLLSGARAPQPALDSLLSRISSPKLDAGTSARVLKRAERELNGQRYGWQVWSGWALAAVLMACEAVYVAEVIAKVHVLFG
jgi:hypothetical protein